MNADVKDYVVGKVNELMNASTCCKEAKDAAKNWLDAIGTDKESEASKNLIAEIEEAQVFGEETAKNVRSHAEEIKASGAKYCDCAACAACEAILEKKDEIL